MYREEYTGEIPSRDTLTAGVCPVQWALGVARAAREASDGKNVMGSTIISTPGCEHSSAAAADILWSLENNTLDWNNHRRKKCANGVCWENVVAAAAAAGGEGRRRRRRGGSDE